MCSPEIERLYRNALLADEAFQRAVVAQFGEKLAGDMRYMTARHNEETCRAGDAKRLADDSYLAAVRKARPSPNVGLARVSHLSPSQRAC
jgi:hypothetical protein